MKKSVMIVLLGLFSLCGSTSMFAWSSPIEDEQSYSPSAWVIVPDSLIFNWNDHSQLYQWMTAYNVTTGEIRPIHLTQLPGTLSGHDVAEQTRPTYSVEHSRRVDTVWTLLQYERADATHDQPTRLYRWVALLNRKTGEIRTAHIMYRRSAGAAPELYEGRLHPDTVKRLPEGPWELVDSYQTPVIPQVSSGHRWFVIANTRTGDVAAYTATYFMLDTEKPLIKVTNSRLKAQQPGWVVERVNGGRLRIIQNGAERMAFVLLTNRSSGAARIARITTIEKSNDCIAPIVEIREQ